MLEHVFDKIFNLFILVVMLSMSLLAFEDGYEAFAGIISMLASFFVYHYLETKRKEKQTINTPYSSTTTSTSTTSTFSTLPPDEEE